MLIYRPSTSRPRPPARPTSTCAGGSCGCWPRARACQRPCTAPRVYKPARAGGAGVMALACGTNFTVLLTERMG